MVDLRVEYRESIEKMLTAIKQNETELENQRKNKQAEIKRITGQVEYYQDLKAELSRNYWKIATYFIKKAFKSIFGMLVEEPEPEEIASTIGPVENYLIALEKLPTLVSALDEAKQEYDYIREDLKATKNQRMIFEGLSTSK